MGKVLEMLSSGHHMTIALPSTGQLLLINTRSRWSAFQHAERGEVQEAPLLTKEPLLVDGFLWRESHFAFEIVSTGRLLIVAAYEQSTLYTHEIIKE